MLSAQPPGQAASKTENMRAGGGTAANDNAASPSSAGQQKRQRLCSQQAASVGSGWRCWDGIEHHSNITLSDHNRVHDMTAQVPFIWDAEREAQRPSCRSVHDAATECVADSTK